MTIKEVASIEPNEHSAVENVGKREVKGYFKLICDHLN